MRFRLINLFVPKYNNKNLEMRKDAIGQTKNLNLLAIMAEKDADQSIRETASKRFAELG